MTALKVELRNYFYSERSGVMFEFNEQEHLGQNSMIFEMIVIFLMSLFISFPKFFYLQILHLKISDSYVFSIALQGYHQISLFNCRDIDRTNQESHLLM